MIEHATCLLLTKFHILHISDFTHFEVFVKLLLGILQKNVYKHHKRGTLVTAFVKKNFSLNKIVIMIAIITMIKTMMIVKTRYI